MLRSLDHLLGYRIAAVNGGVGTLADLFFVDDSWMVRYLLVAAGGWLNRKTVLLSASAIGDVCDANHEICVELTREMVLTSPGVDSDRPVSRQKEILLSRHYGWKPYWTPDPFLGLALPSERMQWEGELEGSNPHLRSFREVTTYVVEGAGARGHLVDMIAREPGWNIDSLVVSSPRDRVSGLKLLAAGQVREIDWTNRMVHAAYEPAALPPFDPAAPVNPRRVAEYFDYHGLPHHATLLPEKEEQLHAAHD
jgi:hypothetical protein